MSLGLCTLCCSGEEAGATWEQAQLQHYDYITLTEAANTVAHPSNILYLNILVVKVKEI